MYWEFDGLPMPVAPLVYVDVLQVLDLMPISVTCYIVSRDQPRRCSTVYLVLGKTLERTLETSYAFSTPSFQSDNV